MADIQCRTLCLCVCDFVKYQCDITTAGCLNRHRLEQWDYEKVEFSVICFRFICYYDGSIFRLHSPAPQCIASWGDIHYIAKHIRSPVLTHI